VRVPFISRNSETLLNGKHVNKGVFILREEDLKKLAREGKLQETLKELKRLSETWNKMASKHKSILASYASIRPASTDSMEAVMEKEKELTNTFERDIEQIEEYLARKDSLE